MAKKIFGLITLLSIYCCTVVKAQIDSLPTKLAAYKKSATSNYTVVKKANVVYKMIK